MIKKYYEFINESNKPYIKEIFYHGTPNEFDVKDIKLPAHFGTKQAALEMGHDKMLQAHLDLKNPIRLIDNEVQEWSLDTVGGSLKNTYGVSEEEWEEFYDKYGDVQGLIELLESKDYDSIVYENRYEDVGNDSYIVFRKEQIIPVVVNESFTLPDNIKYEYIDNGKGNIIGIEASYINRLIASISFGVMKERYTDGYSKDDLEFNKLVYGYPFITNISVLEEYKKQGLATKLYEKAFEELRNQGYKKVFSGLTRNSMYVNNIWNRFADGYELIGNRKIYYKYL